MNIYLIERTDRISWNEYISIVVYAKTKKEALKMYPGTKTHPWGGALNPTFKCRRLGRAPMFTKRGIIVASFNGG